METTVGQVQGREAVGWASVPWQVPWSFHAVGSRRPLGMGHMAMLVLCWLVCITVADPASAVGMTPG